MLGRCWFIQECTDNCVDNHGLCENQLDVNAPPAGLVPSLPSIRGPPYIPSTGLVPAMENEVGQKPSDIGSRVLRVPPDFSMRSGSDSTNTGRASQSSEQRASDMKKLQGVIRDFVKEVLRGIELDVVLEDGSCMSCNCWMDSRLSVLSLRVRDVVREICMSDIDQICSGKELKTIRTTTPLDKNCTTFVLANDQCVTFKFPDVQAREHFATCMKVLRLATS